MAKTMKKSLAILLALSMVMSMVGVTVFADGDEQAPPQVLDEIQTAGATDEDPAPVEKEPGVPAASAPTEEPPVEEEPAQEPPVEKPPVEEEPAKEPPAEEEPEEELTLYADGTLDIANGSILITETGYAQGSVSFANNGTGWSVDQAETPWPDEGTHDLTVVGTSETTNRIVILGGDPILTLKDATVNVSSGGPAIGLVNGADEDHWTTATLNLEGSNTLVGKDWPGILISKYARLTIQGEGALSAEGAGTYAPGIGSGFPGYPPYAMNRSTNKYDGSLRAGGELVIDGGAVTARNAHNSTAALGSAVHDNDDVKFGKITVNGGQVVCQTPNNGRGLSAGEITVTGGRIHLEPINSSQRTAGIDAKASFSMSGGTITMGKATSPAIQAVDGVSITGGNVNGYYTDEIAGRALTVLYVVAAEGELRANTPVTVTEGEHTWTAYTNGEGVITTYLAADTDSITAAVAGSDSSEIPVADGKALIGTTCTCAEGSGTLTMTTPSQSVTAVAGQTPHPAKLTLSAAYEDNCPALDGFHGAYEEDPSYEVVSVVKNGQPQEAEGYVTIEGSAVTFQGDAEGEPYTVTLRALLGVYHSEPITVTVNTYASPAEAGELDIFNGSILITETGYAQGSLKFEKGTGFSVVDGEGQPAAETAWPDATHALTVTGTSDKNNIVIAGGAPTVTLKDLTISGVGTSVGSCEPAMALLCGTGEDQKTTATLVLEGENTLTPTANSPAILVPRDTELTIAGAGTLTAAGTNRRPGIGGTNSGDVFYCMNPETKQYDANCREGGALIVESGIVVATSDGASLGAALDNMSFSSIAIRGGSVICQHGNNQRGIRADNVEISGGQIRMEGTDSRWNSHGFLCGESFTMSGGTVTIPKYSKYGWGKNDDVVFSITGGNSNGYYTGEIAGRALTVLYVVTAEGEFRANTPVTVTEGEHTWTAYTDDKGVITTYLAADTSSITAAVAGSDSSEIPVADGKALIGTSCICGTHPGTLTMTTPSQSVTTVNGQATLDLAAAYTRDAACRVPEGYGFHGAYEEDPSYEVVSVVKNGQFQQADRYVSFAGSAAIFYGDVDQDPYTVTLRALLGPESSRIYSQPITVTVNTYVSQAEAGELDIADGSILITETGYAQGSVRFANGTGWSVDQEETPWPDEGTHALKVVGTSKTTNRIIILGGEPILTLKDATVDVLSGGPAIGLVNGADADHWTTATLNLEGNNTLVGRNWPGILISKYARLTIQGDGALDVEATGSYAPGIGTGNPVSPYAINRSTNKQDSNLRAGGELVIDGGAVTARNAHTSTAALGSAASSDPVRFGKITIHGGQVVCQTQNNSRGLSAGEITITGGRIHVEPINSNQRTSGIEAKASGTVGAFSMSGGTITMGQATSPAIQAVTGVSITGGNVNGYYAGEEANGRVLTRLYFVHADGAPVADTPVTVTEGEHTWTAYTNGEGVITTYFGTDTQSIQVSYGSVSNESVALKEGQALIGGECTCSSLSAVTWDTGLPASITLYGNEDSTYALAAAKLVVEGDCPMPIHPALAVIGYSLSVTKDGQTVEEDTLAQYAALENGVLTLKPQNAPYTVTLTADAGDKSAARTLEVKKGESEAVIDLSAEADHTRTVESDLTAMVTGNAAAGKVAVTGGTAVLTLNQDGADNVWTVTAAEGAVQVELDAQTVNGKVRFGAAGDGQTVMSYLSAGKVKLNPDSGDITFGADGSVTQGKFTVKNLGTREIAVMGADTEAERTITNHSGGELTLKINGETVTLADGASHTVARALGSEVNRAGTTRTYVLPGGLPIYEHYTESGGTRTYAACSYASGPAPSNLVEGYRLLIVAEGDAQADGYPFGQALEPADGAVYAATYTRSRITNAVVDEDITGTLEASRLLNYANLKELHAESVGDILVYTSNLGELYFGENLSAFSWGPYCSTTGVHVPESNPYFTAEDNVLYTKDYSTLMLIPSGLKGSYTVRPECTRIIASATMMCGLDSITIGENVSYIGAGNNPYMFYNNNVGEFRVAAGNRFFAAKDGVLYDAGLTSMVAYPRRSTRTTLTVPNTLTRVESLILGGTPIRTLVVPEGANIANGGGFERMNELEELLLEGSYAGNFSGAQKLRKVTVPDGLTLTGNTFNSTAMVWVKSAGITVTGEDAMYDGAPHGVTVAAAAEGCTVEYSADGETYSTTAPAYTLPGTYTVYWRITKAADGDYAFDRALYSSRTITISALEAAEDWFLLAAVKPGDAPEGWTPVTLDQPGTAPSLENGYTVKYSKDGTGEATQTVPEEAGTYLVTVDITAPGYVEETLTLGYHVVQPEGKVLSFLTNGGEAVTPILAEAGGAISAPADPVRHGYAFAGWYTDAALRSPVGTFPGTMPQEDTVYYAKWIREIYNITYNGLEGVQHSNPAKYTVESKDFSLSAPVKPGYRFLGWTWEGQDEAQTEVTIPRGSYGEKAYTANWEKITYNISYTYMYDVVRTNPMTYTVDDTSAAGIPLTAPAAREGYTFSGWTIEVEGTVLIQPATGAEIPQGTLGDLILTGIWLVENQTLTLDARGGRFADGAETMTITAEYASQITLTAPTRSGYEFAGWYTDETLETPFTAEQMPLTATLYAKWNSTNSGGGSGSGGSNVTPPITELTDPQVPTTFLFTDVAGHWALDAIQKVYELGLMKGVSADRFAPDMTLDRAMVVTILYRMAGSPAVTASAPFTDVAEGTWYADAVAWAAEREIVLGFGDGTFGPAQPITREQLAAILMRYSADRGDDVAARGDLTIYPDMEDTNDWAAEAMAWANGKGLITGRSDGTLAPQGETTRAETATILVRFLGLQP